MQRAAQLALSAEILDDSRRFLDLFREKLDIYVAASSTFADEAAVLDDGIQGLVGLLAASWAPQRDRGEFCGSHAVLNSDYRPASS
jgi:hypothetical protein